MIDTQGTRLILNLRDAAVHRDAESAFDLTLELMAVPSPAPAPSFVTEMSESTHGTGTRASVISVAEYPAAIGGACDFTLWDGNALKFHGSTHEIAFCSLSDSESVTETAPIEKNH